METAWAKTLSLDVDALEKETMLVAVVDTLSLALCGELKTPLELEAPKASGGIETLTLTERPSHPFDFVLSPWPLREGLLTVEGEARPLPGTGRFVDEAAMRTWLKSPGRRVFRAPTHEQFRDLIKMAVFSDFEQEDRAVPCDADVIIIRRRCAANPGAF